MNKEKLKEKPIKIIAIHRTRDTEYVYAEIIPHAKHICVVATYNSWPVKWYVDTDKVTFLYK